MENELNFTGNATHEFLLSEIQKQNIQHVEVDLEFYVKENISSKCIWKNKKDN